MGHKVGCGQTTVANVNGIYGLFTNPDGFDLTVVDTGETDAFGTYGGDGIDDGWQVRFFGPPPNSSAGPGENPDFDPDDNMAEFLTGFDPTDPLQWFQVRMAGRTGTTAELELNKVIPHRAYRVLAGTDLQDFPETVATFTVDSEEFDKIVEDSGASDDRKFYKVEVDRNGD